VTISELNYGSILILSTSVPLNLLGLAVLALVADLPQEPALEPEVQKTLLQYRRFPLSGSELTLVFQTHPSQPLRMLCTYASLRFIPDRLWNLRFSVTITISRPNTFCSRSSPSRLLIRSHLC
jgi:hypothetical protein